MLSYTDWNISRTDLQNNDRQYQSTKVVLIECKELGRLCFN